MLVAFLIFGLLIGVGIPAGLAWLHARKKGPKSRYALALYLYILGAMIGLTLLITPNAASIGIMALIALPMSVFAVMDIAGHGLYVLLLLLIAGAAALWPLSRLPVLVALPFGLALAVAGLLAETRLQPARIDRAAELAGATCMQHGLSLLNAIDRHYSFDDFPYAGIPHATARIDGQLHLWSYRTGQFEPLPEDSRYISNACPEG